LRIFCQPNRRHTGINQHVHQYSLKTHHIGKLTNGGHLLSPSANVTQIRVLYLIHCKLLHLAKRSKNITQITEGTSKSTAGKQTFAQMELNKSTYSYSNRTSNH